MFAALFFEKDPLRLADLPAGVAIWVQVVGGFSAVALLLWYLLGLPFLRKDALRDVPGWQKTLFVILSAAAAVLYVVFFAVAGASALNAQAGAVIDPTRAGKFTAAEYVSVAAGACAILAAWMPFLLSLGNTSVRRVLALAKLSFKEAIRRRVLYAFSGILLVFLFGSWFIDSKPEHQVSTYVRVVYPAMTALLLLTALLLASFSIPNDIKQQTIHTIVTKPVERFEIVLGRFLGYLALLTIVLVVMTGFSLLYIRGGIHPDAVAESLKARVPLYGDLRFENTDNERTGTNVGREWEYRSYIAKPLEGQSTQYARYEFNDLPAYLAARKAVRAEFTFDIYRTTKGEENRDVTCTFRFSTWRYREGNDDAYRKDRDARVKAEAGKALTAGELAELYDELAKKYGYHEINAKSVTDYHSQDLTLPGGLFANAAEADPERESQLKRRGEAKVPLSMRISCDTPNQYVGMARYDMYLRLDEPGASEQLLFAVNFFKGAFGLWLLLALVTGLAVVLSTYLNGPITLLTTFLLLTGGWGRDFIQEVSAGRNAGGGPAEAIMRIAKRELNGPSVADSAALQDQAVFYSDQGFRFVVRLVVNAIPDIDRSDFTAYVAEGFDISGVLLGLSLLAVVGYLLPWFVLAYYLLKWREIASTT